MCEIKIGGISSGIEDWSRIWTEEPHRTATTAVGWIAPLMTAEELKRQVEEAVNQFEKEKEIEKFAGFKIGDRVECIDNAIFHESINIGD